MAAQLITRTAQVVASLVWLAAVFVAVAWWFGLAATDDSIRDPDFMWRPLDLGDGTKRALGLTASAAAVAGALVLHRSRRVGRASPTRVAVLVPAAAIAAYCGLAYATATAPTIGANIGGGLLVLGAVPFAVAMVVVATLMVRAAHRAHGTGRPLPS